MHLGLQVIIAVATAIVVVGTPALSAAGSPTVELVPEQGFYYEGDTVRVAIRATNPGDVGESQAHVDFAKRIWLKTLIEELNGDLALIAKFWDRNAERTLRNLIKQYGLWDDLERARKQ